ELCVAQEHEWTLSINDSNTVLTAKGHRRRTNRTLSSSAMHPNFPDTSGYAVLHNGFGLRGRRHEQGCFHGRFDGLHANKRLSALHFIRHGINRHDVVSAAGEFAEEHAAEILGIARDANHRDAMMRHETVDIRPS